MAGLPADEMMGNQEDGDEVYRAYSDLLAKLLRPTTRMDEIDDYLIGRTKWLPRREDEASEEEPEDEETETLLDALVHFPPSGVGVLEGYLPHRSYTLLTLFALRADRVLIFLLASLGVKVSDFDWSGQFHALSEEAKLILKSIRNEQRLRRPPRIPRDIRRKIQQVKEKRIAQQTRATPPVKRPRRSESIEAIKVADEPEGPKAGEWIGGFFVEEYEDEKEAARVRLPPPPPPLLKKTESVGPNRRPKLPDRDPRHQSKRAKLASLGAPSSHRPTTTPSPPPPPPPQPPPPHIPLHTTTTAPSQLPSSHGNFVPIRVSNLPIEASLQSLLFFFQHGADIFKVARTQNQRIDALGRNLTKFDPHIAQKYAAKRGNEVGHSKKMSTFGYLKMGDIVQEKTRQGQGNDTQSVLVRLPLHPTNGSSLAKTGNLFIAEFHSKKFFRYDPLGIPLTCSLLSPPT
ncbi:hypothetical protein PCANC_07418 [Puccinia coronata f. sp. avenae]|uniref:Uncharacterized protein n=1 Tax=Puccinia coronata f. sp. avenae TaxID=200324 RepID=A0A2N5T451_9BASI|nr:hypothetical protein PCANC_07418 [Puccinia coronata f. sp. avenae]